MHLFCYKFKDILCSSLSKIFESQKCIKINEILINWSNLNKRMNKLCMGSCIPFCRSSKVDLFFKKTATVFDETKYSYYDHL